MSDPANKRLGDYEILSVLGSGGMGRVYQVRNAITDRVEAMKVLLPDGVVKLMDFGIARTENDASNLTAPGSTLGSMNYMSPEQIRGDATDERSDLYSLGISLYEMVTGEKPFHGDSNFSVMAA